jgi:hypothetical protein
MRFMNNNKIHKTILMLFLAVGIILFSSQTFAVPSLGVATDRLYYVDPGDVFETYQDVFAFGSAQGDGEYEGFTVMSGDMVAIWSNYLDADIYLMTDAVVGSASPTFQGKPLIAITTYDTQKAGPYQPLPYYGLNLGKVCTFDSNGDCSVNEGWTALTADPFQPDPFYTISGILEFTGSPTVLNRYFFAAADLWGDYELHFNSGNGNKPKCNPDGTCTDPSSPRTTSLRVVPEPGTLLLLGSGLMGVGLYRGRKRK